MPDDGSLVRHALFAIRETACAEDAGAGRNGLRTESSNYWNQRQALVHILRYLAERGAGLESCIADADAARVLAGAVDNDSM